MSDLILEAKHLKKVFRTGKKRFMAVEDVSFALHRGECLGIVGESGSGKSTVARMLTRLTDVTDGEILFLGKDITRAKGKDLREVYRNMQMVFQMPAESFDPRCTLGDGIMESMINHGWKRKEAKQKMLELLRMVELSQEYADRYPHQVSGGQCQRAAIARALAIDPQIMICDEATSALDVTVQAQIVELLRKLQREMGLSLLLICHDLALVQEMCDRVLVMYQGSIVEEGTPDEIIKNPQQEYTKLLIDSIF